MIDAASYADHLIYVGIMSTLVIVKESLFGAIFSAYRHFAQLESSIKVSSIKLDYPAGFLFLAKTKILHAYY